MAFNNNYFGTFGNGESSSSMNINDLLGNVMLFNPKMQALWAAQFLVACGFSQAETFMLVIGVQGILDMKAFPMAITHMLIEFQKLEKDVAETDDSQMKRLKQINLELLAFLTLHTMNEHIDADIAKKKLEKEAEVRKSAETKDLGK